MICQQCGKQNDPDAVFCVDCSHPQPHPCPNCATQATGGSRFCKKFGKTLNEVTASAQSVRLTALAFALTAVLALGACGGDETLPPTSDAQLVGPAGGTLTFENGIVLDVPPGAVVVDTEIWITETNCDLAGPSLAAPAYRTSKMTCLGGFSAGPDGLTFAVPITALLPIEPLEPGQVPVQVALDTANNGVRLIPTDLTYDASTGSVTVHNITHFSEEWLMTLYQFVETTCRRCETYDNVIVDSEGTTITQADFCEAYATDVWHDQQPGCCLLLRSERSQCSPGCDCCMEKLMEVETSGVDVTFGDCGIVSSDVHVRYPACPDQTPQDFSESATTPECPDDMKLSIDVQPPTLTLDFCERQNLNDAISVTLSGKTPDGRTAFGPNQLLPRWTSLDPSIAAVNSDNFVCGVDTGRTTLEASLSRDPAMPTGDVTFIVNPREIEGIWHLHPILQEEYCRYNLGEWLDEEDPFAGFDIELTTMGGDDIAAAMLDADSVMTGTWDSTSGDFTLAINTMEPTECGYFFERYGEDLCDDAIDCAFEACRNITAIEGNIAPDNTNLTADVEWYYSLSFSYGSESRAVTTWECEGAAVMEGLAELRCSCE